MKKFFIAITTLTVLASLSNISFAQKTDNTAKLHEKIKSLETELKKYKNDKALAEKRLKIFDELDYDIYSNQKWDKFNLSHDDNIKVFYPDGSTTLGLDPQHLDALKPMFTFAPDTKITKHPIRFGTGDWTAVIGEMEGTFSKPMPIGNGKTIPPTGKKFKLTMTTIGHWKGERMVEEYLFWDNQAFMKQIGLAQ
ncbi:MAG: ester cyclase [Candidatus Sericytochromatia bacterium]